MRVAVGRPLRYESAREHVTGQALYTDDLVGRLPGVLHAWPVQAPHAHARVQAVQTGAALALPGVVAVLTAADVPGENDVGALRRDEPLLPTEVMFHGQAVAFVLAETEAAARAGAAQVTVAYEPLPAIHSLDAAIAAGSFHVGPLRLGRGEPDAALAAAPHRLTGELVTGAQEHFYLETQTALAYVDEAGSVLVHASTQHPAETQEACARVLGLPKNRVVVQCLRMGGAFGGKEAQANAWAAVAALGAWKTGRPVRVRLGRTQDMVLTGKRHPFLGRFEVGFDGSGRLLALKLDLYSDGGWSLDLSEAVLQRAMLHSDNAYLVPHVQVLGWVAKTHRQSHTAFRGFGGPQGMAMAEEIIDRVARTLGLPPEEVRERNFYREGDTTPYGQAVRDAGRLHSIWTDLRRSSRYAQRRAELARTNSVNPHCKRGLAITPVKFGISFTSSALNQAGALVLIYRDGTVQVNHGGTEMGQGLHTKMLQVAADALGVPVDWVRVMPTRTDKVPNTSATAASCGADLNGAAVRAACETLKARLAGVAARHFGGGVTPADLHFTAGTITGPGGAAPVLDFRAVVQEAYQAQVALFATGYYRTPDLDFNRETGQGRVFHYFVYGAAVSEVEVDAFTGEYRLLRVDILQDAGDSLNPLVDRGQIEGGFVQGLGWLTLEELVWDGQGCLTTRGAATYKIPGLAEVPADFHVALLPGVAEPGAIYGSKAVGEPPFMLALSVREALRDAVAAFGPSPGSGSGSGGPVELAVPATPEAVFWALERVRGEA